MIKFFLIFLLIINIGSEHQNTNPTSPERTLFYNTNIVDVKNGRIIKNQHVLIGDGVIRKISQNLENLGEFDNRINASGKYLMPGLAEMHAHIPQPPVSEQRIKDVLFLYLANGITTIRGMLGHSSHLELREQTNTGNIIGPRIFTSSPSFNGNSIPSPEIAEKKVREYKQAGYDFLKIHPGLDRASFDAMVKTAREENIEFAGHVPVKVGIRPALNSGYASIDHVDGFLEGLVPQSANVAPEQNGFFGYNFTPLAETEWIDDLVALARKNKVWIVPTESLFTKWFAPVKVEDLLALPEMKYMEPETLQNWERVKKDFMNDPEFSEEQWKKFSLIRKELIKKLSENGHGMLLGSDSPQLFNVPGFSIHKEMKDMAEAGMSNLEILRSGTINPAIFFGMEDRFGQVKEGLDADLVLLNSNPLENLENISEPYGVMRQGKWYSREMIDRKLNEIASRAAN